MKGPCGAMVLVLAVVGGASAQEKREAKPMPGFAEIVRMPVVYRVPGMDAVAVQRDVTYKTIGSSPLRMDIYSPPGLGATERRPAIVFVHGGPVPVAADPKDWAVYVSYGRLAGASGWVGVTFNHRFHAPDRVAEAAGDVADLLAGVRKNAASLHVDPDRLAVWAFSGGGPFLAPLLAERPSWLRVVVAYYAVLDLQTLPPGQADTVGPEVRKRFSAAAQLGAGPRPLPPILVARAGRDQPFLNDGLDHFIQAALGGNATLDLLNHPDGRHAFDILDDVPRSREILAHTLEFLRMHVSP
jgi:acetyl esterase/lipase